MRLLRRTLGRFGVGWIVLTVLTVPAAAQEDAVQAYGKLPLYRDISLSPSGDSAVALRAIGDTYQVVHLDFANRSSKVLLAADPDNFQYNWCRFANDTRIVCSIRSYIVMRAGQVGAGYRAYRDGRTVVTRMIAVDVDGGKQLQLIRPAKTRTGGKLVWNAPDQDTVISWLPDDDKHILIQIARDDRLRPSVYKLNIYTNRMEREQMFLPSVRRWYADDHGRLRFAVGYASQSTVPTAFAIDGKKRSPVDITGLGGIDNAYVVGLAADEQSVWVIANHGKNTKGIHRFDIPSARVVETLLSHPEYDAVSLWLDRDTRMPIMASYEGETQHLTWFDKAREQKFVELRRALGGPTRYRIIDAPGGSDRMVIHVEGGGVPPSYYLFDLGADHLTALGRDHQTPWVPPRMISYKASDGLTIPAYLSLPGPALDGPYPTVLYPHGGPWSRTTDRAWFVTQFLVSQGYAVLQPNFRGSDGYGDEFLRAGFRQWGERMQLDVMDGLSHLVDEGIADPERACIVGGSYGGYAALVAAYKAVDRLRCAVSFAGVADLAELKDKWYFYAFGRRAVARIQNGPDMLANSPIENVEKIGLPLLLVHGDVDTTVVIEQATRFVEALDKAGKDYRYIEQRNGDHYFSLQSHRVEYLRAVGEFLAQHIGPEASVGSAR